MSQQVLLQGAILTAYKTDIRAPNHLLYSRAVNSRFDGRIDSLWRIENQWGSIRPWSRRPVASHCTEYSSSDHERKSRKMLSEMFLLLSYLRHCAFTANLQRNNCWSFCEYIRQCRPQFVNGLSPEWRNNSESNRICFQPNRPALLYRLNKMTVISLL